MKMEKDSKASRTLEIKLSRLSPLVKKRYVATLDDFCKKNGIATLEDLFELKLEDSKSQDPRDQGRVEGMVIQYANDLVKSGLNENTAGIAVKALKFFFKSQGLELSIDPEDIPKTESIGRRVALKDEILALWDSPGAEKERNRSILIFLRDSGLRCGDLASFTVGDYRNSFEYKAELGRFKSFDPMTTKKKKISAIVVIGPECVKQINKYLETRPNANDVEPLFPDRNLTPLSGEGISELLRRHKRKLKNSKLLAAHSLRKYHWSSLEAAGVPSNYIRKLQGKKIGGAEGQYSHPEQMPATDPTFGNKLIETYVQNYKALTTFEYPTEAKKISELTNQVKDLTGKVRILEGMRRDNWVPASKRKEMYEKMKAKKNAETAQTPETIPETELSEMRQLMKSLSKRLQELEEKKD